MTTPRTFFVSYHHADATWGRWVAWAVEQLGHRSKFDEWDCREGQDFLGFMDRAAREADATLALLSPGSIDSGFCRMEWHAALARDPHGTERRWIPLRIADCAPTGILATRTWVDLVGISRDEVVARLRTALLEGRPKPAREPVFPADPGDRRFPGVPDDEEIARYRAWALARHRRLKLLGVRRGDLELDLDEVYVPLRSRPRATRLGGKDHLRGAFDVDEARAERDVALEDAFDIAKERGLQVVVFFGEPGAGKTTVLTKALHLMLSHGPHALGFGERTVPIFLRLRSFTEPDLALPLARVVAAKLAEEAPKERFACDRLAGLLASGDVVLFLDGLDEIADDALRARVTSYLSRELPGLDGGLVAITSRYAGYGEDVRGHRVELDLPCLTLDVRPLNDGEVRSFVERWFTAVRRLEEPDPRFWPDAEDRAKGEAAALLVELSADPGLRAQKFQELISTPLLLVLLCIVRIEQGGDLPRGRAEFYERCLAILLGRSRTRGMPAPLPESAAKQVLSRLGYYLHDAERRYDLTADDFAVATAEVRAKLERALKVRLDSDDLLAWLRKDAGVLTEWADGQYGFAHGALQEYCAAVEIASRRKEHLAALAARFGSKWWREVAILSVSLPGHELFDDLVALVLERVTRSGEPLDLSHLRDCVAEATTASFAPFSVYLDAPQVLEEHKRKLLGELRSFEAEPGWREAADALGVSAIGGRAWADGPAVPGVSPSMQVELVHANREQTDSEAPTARIVEPRTGLVLLRVPGGSFRMGAEGFTAHELPVHTVHLSPFFLGMTAVTNAQYRAFVEAARHPAPEYWRDRRFGADDQPVVGVSWHDAMAFCAWLSSGDVAFALPSEAQWERAARGDDERPYPWGSALPSDRLAVFGRGDDGQPEPVGSRPDGAGPYGHLDLAGNVWEWCLDGWDPGAYRGREGVRDPVAMGLAPAGALTRLGRAARRLLGDEPEVPPDARSLRGGSCWVGAGDLRSAGRDWDPAGGRDPVFGFRVAADVPAST